MNPRREAGLNEAFSPDFLDFMKCLGTHRVDCVLVGGYALGVHGVIRATVDIDFLYRRTETNVHRLHAALLEFCAPPQVLDIDVLMTPNIVTQFGQPPLRIDLLNDIDGVSFDEVWDGAIVRTMGDQPLRVIGLAELIRNKESTRRARDRDDAQRLRKQNKGLTL